jgi:two-component system sensor histidine kinase and response regulator WspE
VISDRRKALQAKFQLAARDRLGRLNVALPPLLEGTATPEAATEKATEALRELHTLKGDAKVVGLARANQVAHRLEDLLLFAKAKGFKLAQVESDLVFLGLDLLALIIEDGEEAPAAAPLWAQFSAGIELLLPSAPAPAAVARPAVPATAALPVAAAAAAAAAAPVTSPKLEPVTPGTGPQSAATGPTDARESYIRVPTRLVNQLTTLTAELLLRQTVVDKLVGEVGRLQKSFRLSTEGLAEARLTGPAAPADRSRGVLQALGRELGQVLGRMKQETFENQLQLRELQDRVRELRLRPVGEVLDRFPRLARDVARELGKRVRVEFSGLDVTVDEQVLERLEDPLLHLVRNAVDHGVELPAARLAAGKAEEGTLLLAARQVRGHVELWVEDDGGGLDVARVRAAAVRSGRISEAEAKLMSDEAAAELIFLPGLTTRSATTDVSGRGIGLDVVKQRVEALGGAVRVEGRPGKGTRFVLSVPVSVALSRALLFQAGDGLYALPSAAVVEVLRLPGSVVLPAGEGFSVPFGESRVPLHDLGEILGAGRISGQGDEVLVVVVQREEEVFALRVERLRGERELVQQPLDPFLSGLRLITASSVIDSGRIVLMLNVPELSRGLGRGHAAPRSAATPVARRRRRILVVDDSEVVRDLMVGLAAKLGWQVDEAVDGQDALQKIAIHAPDLIVTDIDMPVLDGIAMLERYRALADGKAPVLVLSTRGSLEDKQRAMAAGANAYLVKTAFSEAEFAQALQLLTGDAGG